MNVTNRIGEIKMTDFEFKKFLEDNSWDYSKNTIEQLMEKELEKEPEEINMEFVDACMYYLTGITEQENPDKKDQVVQKRKRIKFSRILVAAVIVALGLSIGVTAYAKVNAISISDIFVQVFPDHATIDYSNKNTADGITSIHESNLYNELKNGGIENIALPEALYSSEYTDIWWRNDFTSNFVGFNSEIDNKNVSIIIETFTDEQWITNPDVQGDFTASKKVEVNGIDVYLFERNGDNSKRVNTSISYQVGLTQYFIDCHYNIEQAEQFIKTMN